MTYCDSALYTSPPLLTTTNVCLLLTAELKNRQLLHTTYRLYMVAVVAQVFALLFLSLHYARYGYDGRGFPVSKLIGEALNHAA